MNTKWTPGPWKVLRPDQVRGPYGEWICSCKGGRHREQKDAANAQLIAAAPEMAEALESIARIIEHNCPKDGAPAAAIARALLAKIGGGE